jgi:hypothetical protein
MKQYPVTKKIANCVNCMSKNKELWVKPQLLGNRLFMTATKIQYLNETSDCSFKMSDGFPNGLKIVGRAIFGKPDHQGVEKGQVRKSI